MCSCMRIITMPARPAGPRWWQLARVRGGVAPRGRPDDRWIDDASRVARDSYPTIYLSIGLMNTRHLYLSTPSTYLSVYLSVYLSIYLSSTYLSIRLEPRVARTWRTNRVVLRRGRQTLEAVLLNREDGIVFGHARGDLVRGACARE